jgi:hypothetical protein
MREKLGSSMSSLSGRLGRDATRSGGRNAVTVGQFESRLDLEALVCG